MHTIASTTAPNTLPLRIAITGEKGHGKDTVAKLLLGHGFEHETIRFADGLKEMLRAFYRVSGLRADTIERKLEGDLKEVPCEHLRGKTPRYAMQTLGTEWGRDLLGDDVWTFQAGFRITNAKKGSVTPDLRFPNEGETCEALGLFRLRVENPNAERNGSSGHVSEQGTKQIPVHAVIVNNGTLEDLAGKVARLVQLLSSAFEKGVPLPTPSLEPKLVL